MAAPVVFWDFDNTLVKRDSNWAQAVVRVLDDRLPGHGVDVDVLRPHFRHGFPWHEPLRPHLELCVEGAWWEHGEGLFAAALTRMGIEPHLARRLARPCRGAILDPAIHHVHPETGEALELLAAAGFRHCILSNHVPELEPLVEDLGLRGYFERVITSAHVGYEKPHPAIFRVGLELMGRPRVAWMVGDNREADIAGAQGVGLPAIHVDREAPEPPSVSNLLQAAHLILAQS